MTWVMATWVSGVQQRGREVSGNSTVPRVSLVLSVTVLACIEACDVKH